MTGKTLSHYRIQSELGRGGMGVVYRALDTKLDRQVAIKVLPATALASEDDRARFYREAKAAAQLHHPHIASVFEIDEATPTDDNVTSDSEKLPFIAMEFIDGEPLDLRIKRGPLKLEEAVRVASEIADALKAAHAKDIVHRDIKSANVMLTSDGSAKVLDFGLAKTSQSTMLTRMGSTLGTIAYMSPEQARGEEVDLRSDLYSLGVVLYEMIAGRLPYSADYEQAVVYSILNEDPEPLTGIRTGVPMEMEHVVAKCLEKDRELRYQSAAGLIADLKTFQRDASRISRPSVAGAQVSGTASIVTGTAVPGSATEDRSPKTKWPVLVVIGLLLLAGGIAAGAAIFGEQGAPSAPIRQMIVELPDLMTSVDPAISPNGRYWAFFTSDPKGTLGLAFVDVATGKGRIIPNSNGMQGPEFSPDGAWVIGRRGDRLSRILVPSGRPSDLPVRGTAATWLSNDEVLITDRTLTLTLFGFASQSTSRFTLEGLKNEVTSFDGVKYVQGANVVLVTAQDSSGISSIVAFDPDERRAHVVLEHACCARPIGTDYLLYTAGDSPQGPAMVQRMDFDRSELVGSPVDLLGKEVYYFEMTVGGDDTFLFTMGGDSDREEVVERFNPNDGTLERFSLPLHGYDRLSMAPDGRAIAIESDFMDAGGRHTQITIYNVETGAQQRLTYRNADNRAPAWSRNGRIFYATGSPSRGDIYAKRADGTGAEELIVRNADYPNVSRDGKWLAYTRTVSGKGDLYALELETGTEIAVDTTDGRQGDPAISPDGRYIAFTGDPSQDSNFVSGEQRLFVRSFPDGSDYFEQVIPVQADDPVWSDDGGYLYYRARGRVFRIAVDTKGAFRKIGTPEEMIFFSALTIRMAPIPGSDEILIVRPVSAAKGVESTRIRLIESFSAYVESLLQSAQ